MKIIKQYEILDTNIKVKLGEIYYSKKIKKLVKVIEFNGSCSDCPGNKNQNTCLLESKCEEFKFEEVKN